MGGGRWEMGALTLDLEPYDIFGLIPTAIKDSDIDKSSDHNNHSNEVIKHLKLIGN